MISEHCSARKRSNPTTKISYVKGARRQSRNLRAALRRCHRIRRVQNDFLRCDRSIHRSKRNGKKPLPEWTYLTRENKGANGGVRGQRIAELASATGANPPGCNIEVCRQNAVVSVRRLPVSFPRTPPPSTRAAARTGYIKGSDMRVARQKLHESGKLPIRHRSLGSSASWCYSKR